MTPTTLACVIPIALACAGGLGLIAVFLALGRMASLCNKLDDAMKKYNEKHPGKPPEEWK